MRRLGWLIAGVGIGFAAAHFIDRNPKGHEFFRRVNRGFEEFNRAFAVGYRNVEAEAGEEAALDEIEAALRGLADKNESAADENE